MAILRDARSGLAIGDPASSPLLRLSDRGALTAEQVDTAFRSFILSASGFRTVFAEDGAEESRTEAISPQHAALVAFMVTRFVSLVPKRPGGPCLAVGIDSRPTGPAIADACIRAIRATGAEVRFLFITPAPEIMAYARSSGDLDGFVYVSASHNPVGHNGLKFGLTGGGVLEPSDAAKLIRLVRDPGPVAAFADLAAIAERAAKVGAREMSEIFAAAERHKIAAAAAYRRLTEIVVTGATNTDQASSWIETLRSHIERTPVGIVAELNGSARTVSIDREFLSSLGVDVEVMNGTPGQIVHRIVPEGVSLEPAREALERRHRADPKFTLAYVPDNDGDRGNIVFMDGNVARPIEAQDVFALACLAELAWLVYVGAIDYDDANRARQKVAVVVNDPTSMRIDRIAEAFDARVARAEVGEANVVNLAHTLRKSGYIVRVLGEGSNGGNITHPSAVRDPIDTVASIVKLVTVRSTPEKPSPMAVWHERRALAPWVAIGPDGTTPSGTSFSTMDGPPGDPPTLSEVLASMPRFVTTSAYEERAILRIGSSDHGALKAHYEEIFAREWLLRKDKLADRFGIRSWQEFNYEGIDEREGVGSAFRTPPERGGLKIVFKNEVGRKVAFIWMRGSGTEPVFRVLADAEGSDPAIERYLLEWHVSMVESADRLAREME